MKRTLVAATIAVAMAFVDGVAAQRPSGRQRVEGPAAGLSIVVGRPTDTTATLSVLSATCFEARIDYGSSAAAFDRSTPIQVVDAGKPAEFELRELAPNAVCGYRLMTRPTGGSEFIAHATSTFHTQRAPGAGFVFTVQGDSHPERVGRMFDPDLYTRTLANVRRDHPDFHVMMGDDFSIERVIERGERSQSLVDDVYAHQRGFLGTMSDASALFLVNGNHEQAARYLLDGTRSSFAVMAANARLQYFPLPAPDGFFTGNPEPIEHVGLPRDYYAWTWGDALFVVIDPYWHTPVVVDNEAGVRAPANDGKGGKGTRDLWAITLGEAQYRWLESTLASSTARWRFVFSHHVLGTGRGGIEQAGLFEWGGNDRRGGFLFPIKRPGWDLPIHDLMARHGVTIFFQGHDHLFARQQLDGVVYQSCPNPADPTYTAFNSASYHSGDILPNSGHLRVAVDGERVRVDYVRSYLAGDVDADRAHGLVDYTYTIEAAP